MRIAAQRKGAKGRTVPLCLVAFAMLFASPALVAQSDFLNPMSSTPPGGWKEPAAAGVPQLEGVTITQKLDSRVDLDLEFTDSTGERVTLGDLFGDKPVVLSLVYFDCPMLCTLELNGLLKAMRAMPGWCAMCSASGRPAQSSISPARLWCLNRSAIRPERKRRCCSCCLSPERSRRVARSVAARRALGFSRAC